MKVDHTGSLLLGGLEDKGYFSSRQLGVGGSVEVALDPRRQANIDRGVAGQTFVKGDQGGQVSGKIGGTGPIAGL